MKREISKELHELIVNYDYSSCKMSFWQDSGNFMISISVFSFCLILMIFWASIIKPPSNR